MRHFKTENILTALLPLFFFALFSTSLNSIAKGKAGPPVKAPAPEAPLKTPHIPVNPHDIKQIFIPGGKVTLGSDERQTSYAYSIGGPWAKKWRWFDGEKKRDLFVGDFYIDKYPVTEAQYAQFVHKTGHRVPFISEEDYQKQGFLVHPYREVRPYLWDKATKAMGGIMPPTDKLNNPVVLVSVGDAEAYCRWRGGFARKKTFSLPTEDQWEKAARGNDGRYFPWGNTWDESRANIWDSGPHGTTPVDKYDSGLSPYGVSDMAGNIFEWTGTPAEANPNRHILKSCSWDDKPGFCRGAARHSRLKTSRHILIGFRCTSVTNDK